MRRALQLLLVGMFVLLAACGGNEDPGVEPPEETEATSGDPAVTITMPGDGTTVPAGDVDVTIRADSFEIVDKLGQDPVEGEGHVHFYIDVDEIPTTPGQPAVTDDAKTYHAAATTSYTWPDVESGQHTFAVQLVNNNHTPLEPAVTEEVTVTVE